MALTQKAFTPTDIKRVVRQSAGPRNNKGWLATAEVDGKLWLTDSHWAVPITHHLSAFCEAFGIVTMEPKVWQIDAAKEAHDSVASPPNLNTVLPNGWDRAGTKGVRGWSELVPTTTPATGRALVFVDIDDPALVLASEDGKVTTAAKVDYLRVFGGGWDVGSRAGHDDGRLTFEVEHRGSPYYLRLRIFGTDALKPLVVALERRDQGARASSTGPWVEQLRGILMPVRLGGLSRNRSGGSGLSGR